MVLRMLQRMCCMVAICVYLMLSQIAAQALLLVGLPFLSRRAYNRLAQYVQGMYLKAFVQLYERNANLKIYVSGDAVDKRGSAKDSALVVINHAAAHGDWAPLYSLAARAGLLGAVKTVAKASLIWAFPFGTGMWLMNWPLLKRKWQTDKGYLERKLRRYGEDGGNLQLWLFPEGTRWTKAKHAEAVSFAKERKICDGWLPKHTMVPRVKGFVALKRGLHGIATHMYDVTVAYTGFELKEGEKGPGLSDVFLPRTRRGAKECAYHLHVRRIEIDQIPDSGGDDDGKLKEFIYKTFKEKDALLEKFYEQEQPSFPGPRQLAPLPASDWMPPTIFFCSAIAGACGFAARFFF